MTLLRGKGTGLEIVFSGRDIDDALAELEGCLNERPGFYRGIDATAAFDVRLPTPEQFDRLRELLNNHGVRLTALSGGPGFEDLAAASGLLYVPMPDHGAELERRRALRPKRELQLSDAARSLAADFAGARNDIAERRKRGERSVRPILFTQTNKPEPAAPLALVEPVVPTLYHVGTLRGGQSLHNVGNIVVVGDVNPGAELVASGDIVVFGALRGVAHAGAQGETAARVYALELAPTQLRIATFIAAESEHRPGPAHAEAAYVEGDRIAVAPYDRIEHLGASAPAGGVT